MLVYFEQIKQYEVVSDFLNEYISFKDENQDSVLLFQIGNFYETFFEDAKIFSDITGITLSSRSVKGVGEILQAGINKNSLNTYIKKLLNENLKICICEQFLDENENNKAYRKITRKFTKGTIVESEFLESTENNYIMALCLYDDNFYISYADVSTGQLYKTKANFEQTKFEIEKICPDELLISNSLYEIFKDFIKKYNTTILPEEYFNYKKIENTIISYFKNTQKEYASKLDNVIEYEQNSYLTMDEITRRNLELTRVKSTLKKKGSLLWFLNYTKTPMGSRLLKKYLDEPLLDVSQIKKRQDALSELIEDDKRLFELEKLLEEFCDLSRVCAGISNSTIYPKDLLKIAQDAKNLEKMSDVCSVYKSDLLKINREELNNTLKLANEIKNSLNSDLPNELKSGNIIKDGSNSDLDYLRKKLREIEENISTLEKKEQKRLGMENLKIEYSSVLGFYIEVPSKKQNVIPENYYKKQALSHCTRYFTDELRTIEDEYFNLKFRANRLEYELYCALRKKASLFVDTIRCLAKEIARIDVLVSYALCALLNNLIRPDFNFEKIYIKDGFHPSLIKLKNEVVKNDTSLENSSMIILTGANMSGKSTYLKHNAIICLLSQIGSFVPAKSADIEVVDKIFFRQGANDDIINNNSSFMVEMNDLKFIIDNATSSSLILLDEPAKSTSSNEGGAIARAFCEYVLENIKAKTIVATHNLELTKIEQNYPKSAKNFVMGNDFDNNNFVLNRKIKPGIINSSCAINAAILANLPKQITDSAKKYIN